MNTDVHLQYLLIPTVIRGKHAELLAKDGRRLCAQGILLERIGDLSESAARNALWRSWSQGLVAWYYEALRNKRVVENAWQRRARSWANCSARRVSMHPAYKGKRRRYLIFEYPDWDEACRMMMRQIRSQRFYRSLNGWGRWACFAVGNARKRTENTHGNG